MKALVEAPAGVLERSGHLVQLLRTAVAGLTGAGMLVKLV